MNRAPSQNTLAHAESPITGFDAVIEWVLVGLMAFTPLALGVVAAWSEAIAMAGAAVIAACLVLKRVLHRESRQAWSWAYVPMLLFILLVLVQLLPMSPETLNAISSNTVTLKAGLLRDLPNSGALLNGITLSFYPLATRHDLRIIFFAIVIFFAVVDGYRRPKRIKRLLTFITVIGGAILLLALVQDLSGTKNLYWTFALPIGIAPHSGPFVNKAHYSQFMHLSIGAAFGLLMIRLTESRNERKRLRRRGSSEEDEGQRPLRELTPLWWIAAIVLLGAVTICLSMSRAGMVALFVASAVTALMIARYGGMKGAPWVLTIFGFVLLLALLCSGFDSVYTRLATIANSPDPTSGRLEENRDILAASRMFPLLGTGLGTHAVIYPMFDRSSLPGAFSYADNDYFQMLEETGVVGLCLVLAFVAFVWRQYLQAAMAKGPEVCIAAFGLGYGLLAVMIVSTTDYGQHLPSIACLTAITCGLLFNLASLARAAEVTPAGRQVIVKSPVSEPRGRFSPLPLAIPAVLVACAGWVLPGSVAAFRAELNSNRAKGMVAATASQTTQAGSGYAQAAALAASAVACEPGNAERHYWMNCYQWEAIKHTADPKTGVLKLSPEVVSSLRQIIADFAQARTLCPTYGPAWSVEGQIKKFILNDPSGTEDIRIGYELCRNHPTTSFIAGKAAVMDGQWDESVDCFRRTVVRDGEVLPEIIGMYAQHGRPELAVLVGRVDAECLLSVATALRQMPIDANRQRALTAVNEAIAAMKEQGTPSDSTAWKFASMALLCRQEKDNAAAVDYYRKALQRRYEEPDWHLALARALSDEGEVGEAMHEARICLRLRPRMEEANQLLSELSIRPGATLE